MLKKIGLVTATMAAGAFMFGGIAAADTTDGSHQGHHYNGRDQGDPGPDQIGQLGLLNLNNVDLLHNVNAVVGVCGNDINVLGVQVPIRNALNGIGIPILSPGENKAAGDSPSNCASGGVVDGGSIQGN